MLYVAIVSQFIENREQKLKGIGHNIAAIDFPRGCSDDEELVFVKGDLPNKVSAMVSP